MKIERIAKKNVIFLSITRLCFKEIKLCPTAIAIAEQSHADALPIAGAHGERFFHLIIIYTIGAIGELVTVLHTVVGDAQPELFIVPILNNPSLSLRLNEDAILTQADTPERLTRTEESGIAVARGREQRGIFVLIAHHLLRQHVTTKLQTVGRQSLQREPTLAFI